MRNVFFTIGFILFFVGLILHAFFGVFTLMDRGLGSEPLKDLSQLFCFSTVSLFVGAYLVSNNNSEDK